ncbi:MAG: radical SAM protein [Thermodesulfobacteriota bacterium]|nr:radical SAM protein [Thermodesulfobacteriota bacterium]
MDKKKKTKDVYHGFEQGPIRPPSEAHSLLIRISRNCPWNRCGFCPVYKGSKFSLRDPEHVKRDIDTVHKYVTMIQEAADDAGSVSRDAVYNISRSADTKSAGPGEQQALQAALHWYSAGMRSVFLQDANTLIIKPDELIDILKHLKARFPQARRITSYARSHTVSRIKQEKLEEIRQAGLNRIHIGMESGSDKVLEMVKKGSTKADHIKAGQKAKQAGFELSEYVMPGLGGQDLSKEHATETADALNQIDPDFIRLRTLAIPSSVPLYEDYTAGRFKKCTDLMMAEEILLFLESLDGIHARIVSDHILNLFEEVEGDLPQDKEKMMQPVRRFLEMPAHDQMLYQVGRRLGYFSRLDDMADPGRTEKIKEICTQMNITPENADAVIEEVMNRFI